MRVRVSTRNRGIGGNLVFIPLLSVMLEQAIKDSDMAISDEMGAI